MKSIVNTVDELMNLFDTYVKTENPIEQDDIREEIDEKILSMWKKFSVAEVSKELAKYETINDKWGFIEYIWKVKEYVDEV